MEAGVDGCAVAGPVLYHPIYASEDDSSTPMCDMTEEEQVEYWRWREAALVRATGGPAALPRPRRDHGTSALVPPVSAVA